MLVDGFRSGRTKYTNLLPLPVINTDASCPLSKNRLQTRANTYYIISKSNQDWCIRCYERSWPQTRLTPFYSLLRPLLSIFIVIRDLCQKTNWIQSIHFAWTEPVINIDNIMHPASTQQLNKLSPLIYHIILLDVGFRSEHTKYNNLTSYEHWCIIIILSEKKTSNRNKKPTTSNRPVINMDASGPMREVDLKPE